MDNNTNMNRLVIDELNDEIERERKENGRMDDKVEELKGIIERERKEGQEQQDRIEMEKEQKIMEIQNEKE